MEKQFRKGLALLLTLAMVVGIIPSLPGGANTVQAATGSGTDNTPGVSAFATKTQLMTAFTRGKMELQQIMESWYLVKTRAEQHSSDTS